MDVHGGDRDPGRIAGAVPVGRLRWIALGRGLRLSCPQCGRRGLFRGYARLRERCPTCELVLRREQGAQTGSMYMTAAVCQVFAAVVIWLCWLFTGWSTLTFLLVAIPLVLAFCAAFLPLSQTLWIAVEYVTDAVNGEDWVHPRV